VRRAECGACPALPGDECLYTTMPVSVPVTPDTPVRPARGYHVARFAWAEAHGLISAADMDVVLEPAGPFTAATIVYDATPQDTMAGTEDGRTDVLPYDQIPQERLAVGDLATPLGDELGVLNVNLAVWMARDDSKAGASVVRAGNQVMTSIDAMLRQLHELRARMVAERREDQDIAAARVDAYAGLGRQLRQEAGQ